MKFILTDIEGTTTSISFVHDELFPYSKERMSEFLKQNYEKPEVIKCIDQVKDTVLNEQNKMMTNIEVSEQLIEWINLDRKHPALKELQGLIWEKGYESGEIKGHVYEDVMPALKKWKDNGITLAIYSSGSVKAQKLLFQYSTKGNLLSFFSHQFDTAVGNKREVSSYKKIATELNCLASDILFLSDIKEELDAAREAGMKTIQLVRDDQVIIGNHPQAKSFSTI
ncbi:MAG: acireductone synthase [Bacteriovoracaceae bacterium]|nr:acireductone synthase [Bacteriovoracaceae bacterium]